MIPSVREIVFSAAISSSSMGRRRKGGKGGGGLLLVVALRRNPRIVFMGGLGVSNRHVVWHF